MGYFYDGRVTFMWWVSWYNLTQGPVVPAARSLRTKWAQRNSETSDAVNLQGKVNYNRKWDGHNNLLNVTWMCTADTDEWGCLSIFHLPIKSSPVSLRLVSPFSCLTLITCGNKSLCWERSRQPSKPSDAEAWMSARRFTHAIFFFSFFFFSFLFLLAFFTLWGSVSVTDQWDRVIWENHR